MRWRWSTPWVLILAGRWGSCRGDPAAARAGRKQWLLWRTSEPAGSAGTWSWRGPGGRRGRRFGLLLGGPHSDGAVGRLSDPAVALWATARLCVVLARSRAIRVVCTFPTAMATRPNRGTTRDTLECWHVAITCGLPGDEDESGEGEDVDLPEPPLAGRRCAHSGDLATIAGAVFSRKRGTYAKAFGGVIEMSFGDLLILDRVRLDKAWRGFGPGPLHRVSGDPPLVWRMLRGRGLPGDVRVSRWPGRGHRGLPPGGEGEDRRPAGAAASAPSGGAYHSWTRHGASLTICSKSAGRTCRRCRPPTWSTGDVEPPRHGAFRVRTPTRPPIALWHTPCRPQATGASVRWRRSC